MKKLVGLFLIFYLFSCSKNTTEEVDYYPENNSPKYDTLPIDSFSKGAVSVDVARKIRISSKKYQDSLREIRVNLEKEKLLKKEAEEKLKAEKLLEEIKKKAETEKLKKEKPAISPSNLSPEKSENL